MITVIGLVALMNIVNFSDGVDGLAAGVSAIIAIALAVIAISLYYEGHHLHSLAPAVFAALIAGGAPGLPRTQLPARVELHGRLRREPARAADGLPRGRGDGEDRSR